MATTTTRKKPTDNTVDVEIDETTEAQVIVKQTPNGETKEIRFTGKPKQNDTTENNSENENQVDDGDFQGDYQGLSSADFIIPKDKIDTFFDKIEAALENESDNFLIRVLRTPDSFDDDFYIKRQDLTSLGVFGCRLSMRYKISELLQKANSNSGGRFNLIALDVNQQTLQYYAGTVRENGRTVEQFAPVIARDVFIPNPTREELTNAPAASDTTKILEVMQQQHRDFMNALNNRGQSEIEKLLLTKAVDMITNPPQQNGGGIENFLEKLVLLPQISQRLGDAMFPKPPMQLPPAERTTFDKVMQVLETPMAQNAIEKVTDILDAVAAAKFPQNQQQQQWQPPVTQENPQELPAPEQVQQQDDMQAIIQTLIQEIEAETPIDSNNQTIINLKAQYSKHFGMVTMLCKNMPFSDVLDQLMAASANIQPFPFAPFIDPLESQNQQKVVFTEHGNKAIKRLEEVYNFLRSG